MDDTKLFDLIFDAISVIKPVTDKKVFFNKGLLYCNNGSFNIFRSYVNLSDFNEWFNDKKFYIDIDELSDFLTKINWSRGLPKAKKPIIELTLSENNISIKNNEEIIKFNWSDTIDDELNNIIATINNLENNTFKSFDIKDPDIIKNILEVSSLFIDLNKMEINFSKPNNDFIVLKFLPKACLPKISTAKTTKDLNLNIALSKIEDQVFIIKISFTGKKILSISYGKVVNI